MKERADKLRLWHVWRVFEPKISQFDDKLPVINQNTKRVNRLFFETTSNFMANLSHEHTLVFILF
jgi:hypothetical protein